MFDLSIIIVGHNHQWCLENNLEVLFNKEHNLKFEVLFVDNASTDKTIPLIQNKFPETNIIRNKQRYGFARNVNIGIKAARNGRYLLLLNPDVKVLPGSLEALVSFMDVHPSVGIAGPMLLNTDRTLQYSCRRFSNPIVPISRFLRFDKFLPNLVIFRNEFMSDWNHGKPRDVDYVTGACMVIRKEALAKAGLMDESFFLYCEDQDLCLRMWINDWQVWYVPNAIMIHDHQRDSAKGFLNKRQITHIQSLIYLFRKYGLRIRRPTH